MSERRLIAVISDEETITGISLVGLEDTKNHSVLQTVKEDTPEEDILRVYRQLMHREDVAILLVGDFVMNRIQKYIIHDEKKLLPNVMVIPSKITQQAQKT